MPKTNKGTKGLEEEDGEGKDEKEAGGGGGGEKEDGNYCFVNDSYTVNQRTRLVDSGVKSRDLQTLQFKAHKVPFTCAYSECIAISPKGFCYAGRKLGKSNAAN